MTSTAPLRAGAAYATYPRGDIYRSGHPDPVVLLSDELHTLVPRHRASRSLALPANQVRKPHRSATTGLLALEVLHHDGATPDYARHLEVLERAAALVTPADLGSTAAPFVREIRRTGESFYLGDAAWRVTVPGAREIVLVRLMDADRNWLDYDDEVGLWETRRAKAREREAERKAAEELTRQTHDAVVAWAGGQGLEPKARTAADGPENWLSLRRDIVDALLAAAEGGEPALEVVRAARMLRDDLRTSYPDAAPFDVAAVAVDRLDAALAPFEAATKEDA